MPDGTARAADHDDPLPPSQTWHPRRQRHDVVLFIVFSALMAAIGAYHLLGGGRVLLGAGYAALAAPYAWLAWRSHRSRLVADATGLHVFDGRNEVTYAWADIRQIRPSIARGRHTQLVVVLDGRPAADLPLTEEHLPGLRRWHARAGR